MKYKILDNFLVFFQKLLLINLYFFKHILHINYLNISLENVSLFLIPKHYLKGNFKC